MKLVEKKNNIALILSLFILTQVFLTVYITNLTIIQNDTFYSRITPITSEPVSAFVIDDLISGSDWEHYNDTKTWCTGGGSEENPYIIDNIEVSGCGSYSPCITIKNSRKYFEIKNCTLMHAESGQSGISLYNTSNGKLHNNTIYNCTSSGIYLYNTFNCEFFNNSISDDKDFSSFYGIESSESFNNKIFDNNITKTKYGIYLHDISNDTVIYKNNIWNISQYAINVEESFDINITENQIYNNSVGILLSSRTGHIINNNTFSNHTDPAITVVGINESKIINNKFYSNYSNKDDSNVIGISYCREVNISNNQFFNNSAIAIEISECQYCNVELNYIEDCERGIHCTYKGIEPNYYINISKNIINHTTNTVNGDAIYLHTSFYCNVFENQIINSSYHGIYLYSVDDSRFFLNNITNSEVGAIAGSDSNNNSIYLNILNKTRTDDCLYLDINSQWNAIYKNIILNSSRVGISLSSSNNNLIHWNDVNNSIKDGIQITDSNYNNLTYNYIYNSTHEGIDLSGASSLNNLVFFNNLIKNGSAESQGRADSDLNSWDNGTHGNYWSNYTDRYPLAEELGYYWSWEYEILDTVTNDTRPLVNMTRDPLSLDEFKLPSLNVMAVEPPIPFFKGEKYNASWKIEYDGGATSLSYKIYINESEVKYSTTGSIIGLDEIIINYSLSDLEDGNWNVKCEVWDGFGLKDEDTIFVTIKFSADIELIEYPTAPFVVGGNKIIKWKYTNASEVILTKLWIYVNEVLNENFNVGEGEGEWNYSTENPYYTFGLSTFSVGTYDIFCRIFYNISDTEYSMNSSSVAVNIVPFVPTLNIAAIDSEITIVKCNSSPFVWEVQYNGNSQDLSYKIFINESFVFNSSSSMSWIRTNGIQYSNDSLDIGDWNIKCEIWDGSGLTDSATILVTVKIPVVIELIEYPTSPIKEHSESLIKWKFIPSEGVNLTGIILFHNDYEYESYAVGTGQGWWNYSIDNPYFTFYLNSFPPGSHNFYCRVKYKINESMCYWDSSTVTVNITEELPPEESSPLIPGYDIPILLGIIIIGTYITFKRKVKKRKKGLNFN